MVSVEVSEDIGNYFVLILRKIGREELKFDSRFYQMVIILLVTFAIQVIMTYILSNFYGLRIYGLSNVKGSDAAKSFTTNCWKAYIDKFGNCVGTDFIDGGKEQFDDDEKWGKLHAEWYSDAC